MPFPVVGKSKMLKIERESSLYHTWSQMTNEDVCGQYKCNLKFLYFIIILFIAKHGSILHNVDYYKSVQDFHLRVPTKDVFLAYGGIYHRLLSIDMFTMSMYSTCIRK